MLKQTIYSPLPASRAREALGPIIADISNCVRVGEMPWVTIPHQVFDLDAIERRAADYRRACDHVVLCGTGGSSLGARALMQLVEHPLGLALKGIPRVHVVESTDPETLNALFTDLPPARTGWVFISKSGTTLETMTQFLCYLEWRSRHKDAVHAPATAITMPGERPLRKLAEKHSIPVMDHPPALGGRFSALSVVGLLPAAIAGVDIAMLRQGAATMLEHEGLYLASQAACWQMECMRRGYGIQILMPYAKKLGNWTLWYRQLWAESLGKDGKGSTPLAAVGPVDQHSMLQLFLDGPKDKSVTLVTVDDVRQYEPLTLPYASDGYDYLAAVSGAEIVQAQAYGTTQAFLSRQMPMREIRLPQLDEYHLGAILMLGMLETVMTAELLGVSAFDQPAVEEGKKITRAMLQQEAGVAEAA